MYPGDESQKCGDRGESRDGPRPAAFEPVPGGLVEVG